MLYYSFNIFHEYENKSTITKFEIEAAGIDWKSFVRKVTQHGWGKQTNTSTMRFLEGAGGERKKMKKVFGSDLKKLKSIITTITPPLKNVRKKSSLPIFGYLGTLWELKGINVLLDSIQQIRHLDFQVLMGIKFERTNTKDVAQLKKLKGYSQIRLIANLFREDFYEEFFSQIDYLIIPSVWEETGPMTLFEAFYYKIPVIISNRPSMIEKTTEGVNSFVFDNASTLSRIMKDVIEGQIPLAEKSQKNFPVKTYEEYTDILEKIYLAKTVSSIG